MVNCEYDDRVAFHDEEDGEWEATKQGAPDVSVNCRIHQRPARELFEQVVDRRQKRIGLLELCIVRVGVGDVSGR